MCKSNTQSRSGLCIHGMYGTTEYVAWGNMLQRCTNPKHPQYCVYGGRGITVCESWRSFEQFYADMGPKPSKDHSIDRIDTNGNYCKENCRWATRVEQNNNTRRNSVVVHNGEERTVAEWARHLGIDCNTLRNRLFTGWSVEEALTVPVKRRKAHV